MLLIPGPPSGAGKFQGGWESTKRAGRFKPNLGGKRRTGRNYRFAGLCKNVELDIVHLEFCCRYSAASHAGAKESLEVRWFSPAEALKISGISPGKSWLEYILNGAEKVRCFSFRKNPFGDIGGHPAARRRLGICRRRGEIIGSEDRAWNATCC